MSIEYEAQYRVTYRSIACVCAWTFTSIIIFRVNCISQIEVFSSLCVCMWTLREKRILKSLYLYTKYLFICFFLLFVQLKFMRIKNTLCICSEANALSVHIHSVVVDHTAKDIEVSSMRIYSLCGYLKWILCAADYSFLHSDIFLYCLQGLFFLHHYTDLLEEWNFLITHNEKNTKSQVLWNCVEILVFIIAKRKTERNGDHFHMIWSIVSTGFL